MRCCLTQVVRLTLLSLVHFPILSDFPSLRFSLSFTSTVSLNSPLSADYYASLHAPSICSLNYLFSIISSSPTSSFFLLPITFHFLFFSSSLYQLHPLPSLPCHHLILVCYFLSSSSSKGFPIFLVFFFLYSIIFDFFSPLV